LTIAPDGKVYVIGGTGVNGSGLAEVEAYDPTTDLSFRNIKARELAKKAAD
jgi:hypothetical protein